LNTVEETPGCGRDRSGQTLLETVSGVGNVAGDGIEPDRLGTHCRTCDIEKHHSGHGYSPRGQSISPENCCEEKVKLA